MNPSFFQKATGQLRIVNIFSVISLKMISSLSSDIFLPIKVTSSFFSASSSIPLRPLTQELTTKNAITERQGISLSMTSHSSLFENFSSGSRISLQFYMTLSICFYVGLYSGNNSSTSVYFFISVIYIKNKLLQL